MSVSAIDQLPSLSETVRLHNLRAEKKLGQNFLLDQNITDKIARCCPDVADTTIFEIGPGPGGLTRGLLKTNAAHVTAIEFDPRAVAALEDLVQASDGRLTIVQGDALSTDLTSLSTTPRAIVANLPYNISTVLLLKWLRQIRDEPASYQFMILMFQKEVADRLTASPGSRDYGRLSVMTQWLCTAQKLFDLPPSAFSPPPKIDSSIVFFRPKQLPENSPQFAQLEKVLAVAFQQRRKMIRSSLKTYSRYFEELGIDPTLRAEDLTLNDYLRLALAAD